MSVLHEALRCRVCPTCGETYGPTVTRFEYGPRMWDEVDDSPSRLESISYVGDCPNGHVVSETVWRDRPALSLALSAR